MILAMEKKNKEEIKDASEKYAIKAIKNLALKNNKHNNINIEEDRIVINNNRRKSKYYNW